MSGRDWRRTEISRRDNRTANFDKNQVTVRNSPSKTTTNFNRFRTSAYIFTGGRYQRRAQ